MKKLILVSLLFFCGCSGKWGLVEKNDFFAPHIGSKGKSDQNFTQGLEFSYTVKEEDAPKFVREIGELIPEEEIPPVKTLKNTQGEIILWSITDPDYEQDLLSRRYRLTVGQHIYTPEDLSRTDLIENDNPYAGWLFADFAKVLTHPDYYSETGITLGIIGPSAQGEFIQDKFHELIDSDDPLGWNNQLRDEPGLVFRHERTWRDWKVGDTVEIDWLSGWDVRLGNVHTDAGVHTGFRVGHDLPDLDKNRNKWSIYGFSDAEVRGVARNIFYDGNTWKDSHRVDTKPVVGQLDSGIAFEYGVWKVMFHIIVRTKDYQEQEKDLHSYGLFEVKTGW